MPTGTIIWSRRSSIRLLFLPAFLQWATLLPAQLEVPGYEIRRIGVQNGLNNQVVTSIVKDQYNALWFGTYNGLYRCNGFQPIRIDVHVHNLPEQLYSNITDLAIDTGANSYLFVCTKYRARIIDPKTRTFITPELIGIPDSIFREFSQIERGGENWFFALRHQTVYKISKKNSRQYNCQPWYNIPAYTDTPLNMLADPGNPEAIWLLQDGRQVWYASPQGVQQYPLPEINKPLPGLNGLLQLAFTSHGIFGWDVARNVYKFDESRRQFTSVSHGYGLYDLVPNLAAIDIAMKQKEGIRCSIDIDIDQKVLGTTLGLFIVRKKFNGFHTIDALKEEEIRGIYIDSTGKWAVGTYYGLYTGKLGEKQVKKRPEIKSVWDFLHFRKNIYLLSLETPNGIQLWDASTNKIVDSSIVYRIPDPLALRSALCMEQDQFGMIWIGTYKNLSWSAPEAPLLFHRFQDPVTRLLFDHPFVRAILATQDSSLWVGSEDGLYRLQYSPTLNQYQLITPDSYIGKIRVSDLYQDVDKNIWVATKGKGLARIDKDRGRINWFSIESGLCDTMVCRIEGSRSDSILWISTHNGLSRLSVHTGIFHNFYEENGFPGNEFNSAASARCKDGKLLFGGINGLIYFHPDSIAVADYLYKTSVNYVQIYSHGVDSLIVVNEPDFEIHSQPYPELIEFVLGTNEFIRPDKIRYRYRLLGLSDKWNYTTGESKVKYVHLSPGQYTFQVQAIPFDGHFGPVFTLPVRISTPYYETWWYKAFIIGIILLIAYAAYRYRLHQIMRAQLIRQQVADDLHDDIGNKLNIIGILSQKIYGALKNNNALAPVNQSLEKLQELSRDTQISLITMIWAVDPTKDSLVNLIVRMQDFADDFVKPLVHQFSFTAPSLLPDRDLNLRVRHHLLLIYQELLANMIKHTHSIRISVDLSLEGDKIILVMINQYHPDLVQEFDIISGNRGQSTMTRRLKEINGSIDFNLMEPRFQKIILTVPKVYKTV